MELAGASASTVIEWTANDIKSAAKKSMKVANQISVNRRTGKSRKLRGDRSKPGEPPYRHKGTIADFMKAVFNADKTIAFVGPLPVSGGKTYSNSVPGKLERGGEFVVVTKTYHARERRNFSPDGVRDQNVNKYGETRAGRPDRKNKTYEKRYRYFYSQDRWEAASESPAFIAWARIKHYTEDRHKATVAARPFMVPAMEKILAEENMAKKLKRVLAKQQK